MTNMDKKFPKNFPVKYDPQFSILNFSKISPFCGNFPKRESLDVYKSRTAQIDTS